MRSSSSDDTELKALRPLKRCERVLNSVCHVRSSEARAGAGSKDWSKCHCCAAFSVSDRWPSFLMLVTVKMSG